MKIQELEERDHMVLVMDDDAEWVMMESGPTMAWLTRYHPNASVKRIAHMAPPKGVHAVIDYGTPSVSALATGCALSNRRRTKYGQSITQAFQEVDEDVTCPTCRARMQEADDAALPVVSRVVLRPWSWDNVPEEYRPGGARHHWEISAYGADSGQDS